MSGKNVRAGGAFIELGIQERIGQGLRRAEQKLQTFGKFAMGIGAAGAGAAAAIIGPALFAASEMEETMSKFDTVFGGSSEAVKVFSDGLASELGRSRQQIAQFMAGSQDLFVPIGFDSATATEMSKTITRLAVDLASFNNVSDTAAMDALQAALLGEGDAMKRFGVILNQATTDQELWNQGIDPKNATEQQKVLARMSVVLAGTTAAQGDATRTAGSFANQMKRLRGNLSNVAVTIGDVFLPPVTRAMQFINEWVTIGGDLIQKNQELFRIIAGGVGVIGVAGAALATAGGAASLLGTIFGGLAGAVGVATTIVGAISVPMLAVGAAVVGVGVAAYQARDYIGQFVADLWELAAPVRSVFADMLEGVKLAVGGMADALAAGNIQLAGQILWAELQVLWLQGTGELKKLWAGAVFGMGEAWDNVMSAIPGPVWTAVDATVGAVKSMAGFFVDAFNVISDAFGTLNRWIVSAFQSTVSTVGGLVARMVDLLGGPIELLAKVDPSGASSAALSQLRNVQSILAGGGKGLEQLDKEDAARSSRRMDRFRGTVGKMIAAESEVDKARRERDALIDKARGLRGEADAKRDAKPEASPGGLASAMDRYMKDDPAAALEEKVKADPRIAALQAKLDRMAAEAESQSRVISDARAFELEDRQQKGLERGSEVSSRKKENAGSFSAMGAQLLGLGGGNRANEETARNTRDMSRTLRSVLTAVREIPSGPVWS